MERVFTLKLNCAHRGPSSDETEGLGDAIARLRALRHRTRSFLAREYAFPDGIRAIACGAFDPLMAWVEVRPDTPAPNGLSIVDRRSVPPPYLDWSSATVVATVPTTEILITHRLLVRVTGDASAGLDTDASAELIGGEDEQRHVDALSAVCETAGFAPLDPAIVSTLSASEAS